MCRLLTRSTSSLIASGSVLQERPICCKYATALINEAKKDEYGILLYKIHLLCEPQSRRKSTLNHLRLDDRVENVRGGAQLKKHLRHQLSEDMHRKLPEGFQDELYKTTPKSGTLVEVSAGVSDMHLTSRRLGIEYCA